MNLNRNGNVKRDLIQGYYANNNYSWLFHWRVKSRHNLQGYYINRN